MTSQSKLKFETELTKLFEARTHELTTGLWPRAGNPPHLTPKKIMASVERLQSLAAHEYMRSKEAKEIFECYDYKKQWHKSGKGHGLSAKKRSFKKWYDEHIETKNNVYVFWKGKRCLYVGRTLNGKNRPTSHFEKHWFGTCTRVDVYGFYGKRNVPCFECMTTHKWYPQYSKITPAAKKYGRVCPICEGWDYIEDEVKMIFRLKH
jgi:hypothetical protein